MGLNVECLAIHDIIQKTGSVIGEKTEGEDSVADRTNREKARLA